MTGLRHMSRLYVLARLLEHGALTGAQLRQITGWDAHAVGNTLHLLLREGTVAITNLHGRRHYLLARDLAKSRAQSNPHTPQHDPFTQ